MKHEVFYIPTGEKGPMLAAFDKLSEDGWEFVTWMSGDLMSVPTSRMAIFRRAHQVKAE